MARYIELDALVAEIEKRIKETESMQPKFDQFWAGQISDFKGVLKILDTLEVKEVDFGTEVYKYTEEHFNMYDDGNQTLQAKDKKSLIGMVDAENIAKHFFELGLKVQHGNWKVVDNINPPQADRNKIYCVLSKNKYLLARVVNHPQDEDLLQWKCTEFPFHRYDMCEGDKYMVIN